MIRKLFVWIVFCVLFGLVNEADAGQAAALPNDHAGIECWWKTDKNAVRLGEHFKLTLTLHLLDTDDEKMVLNEGSLDPSAISLIPYETLSGIRHEEIKKERERFIQYSYVLRMTGSGFFGKDVPIPSLDIKYNVHKTLKGSEVLSGQEKIYTLSPYQVKILTLVPAETNDIRDASLETFSEAETRKQEARVAWVVSGSFLALSLLMLGFFSTALVRYFRGEQSPVEKIFSDRALLKNLIRILRKIRSARVGGAAWDNETLGQAVSVWRVLGSIGLNRPVNQSVVRMQVHDLEGQIKLKRSLFKIFKLRKVLVHSDLTPEGMKREIEKQAGKNLRPKVVGRLKELNLVFGAFSQARYQYDVETDLGYLDPMLNQGLAVAVKMQRYYFWPVKMFLLVGRKLEEWKRDRAWTR